MTSEEQKTETKKRKEQCACTFGVSRACSLHAKKKRRRPEVVTELITNTEPLDNATFAARLHAIVHGSDDKCAYGGIGCPVRRDLRIEVELNRFHQGRKVNNAK